MMDEKRNTDRFDMDRKEMSKHLAMLAHELRTPLAAIRGYTELLENELPPPGQKEKARRIRALTGRLETLISDRLEIAKFGNNRRRPVKIEIELRPFLEQILQDLEPQALAKRHTMMFGGEIPSLTLRTDPELLRSVLSDLLANAIRYTPPQGRIVLRVAQHGETIRIEVQDDGIGIDLEEQTRIYDAFYRTDAATRMDERGSGLGLYLARHYVETLGGTIRVVSRGPGEGSIASVDFPR